MKTKPRATKSKVRHIETDDVINRVHEQLAPVRLSPLATAAVEAYTDALAEIIERIRDNDNHVELLDMLINSLASAFTISLPPKEVLKTAIMRFAQALETQYLLEQGAQAKRQRQAAEKLQ